MLSQHKPFRALQVNIEWIRIGLSRRIPTDKITGVAVISAGILRINLSHRSVPDLFFIHPGMDQHRRSCLNGTHILLIDTAFNPKCPRSHNADQRLGLVAHIHILLSVRLCRNTLDHTGQLTVHLCMVNCFLKSLNLCFFTFLFIFFCFQICLCALNLYLIGKLFFLSCFFLFLLQFFNLTGEICLLIFYSFQIKFRLSQICLCLRRIIAQKRSSHFHSLTFFHKKLCHSFFLIQRNLPGILCLNHSCKPADQPVAAAQIHQTLHTAHIDHIIVVLFPFSEEIPADPCHN